MNKEYLITNKYYLESVMPKMVPSYINSRIGNCSERLVFNLFKNVPDYGDRIIDFKKKIILLMNL